MQQKNRPRHCADLWRGIAFAATAVCVILVAGADLTRAQQPTREEIIESLRAKQLTRCPRFDPTAGCGVAPAESIAEVRFGRGSAAMGAAALSQLKALGAKLPKQEAKGALLVVGHADASGGDDYNQRLSERRAEAVKRFLIARFKLAEDAVMASGRGKSQPKNAGDPFAGENRRVEIMRTASSAVAPEQR
jgi:outer membrane protein OmpA-like peptidoglycan-associated protein